MRSLLLLFSIFCSIGLYAQFTNNRDKFVKEFQKTLSDYGKGEFHDFAKTELPKLLLESSDFPDNYFNKMVETCNLLVAKKMSPYPEIYNYVFSTASFVKSKQSGESYNNWHDAVDKLLQSRNVKKFEDFAEMTAGYFSNRVLVEASNFTWFYEGGTYSFSFDNQPIINFENGNLICRVVNKGSAAKDEKYADSLVVYNTKGSYDPILKKWHGKEGELTWQKVGLDRNETSARFSKYEVSLKTSNLNADSVYLTTPYFKQPVLGQLSDRAFKIHREEDKVYPQFLSYERTLTIKDIKPNVDYKGGFSYRGAKFVGIGHGNELAQIVVKKEGKNFIKVQSSEIYVSKENIKSNSARVAIYIGQNDSITHPGITYSYDLEKKLTEISRATTGAGQSPFQDSYHQLDFYVPKIVWQEDLNELVMTYELGTSQEQKEARFESRNYFDEGLYDRLQTMSPTHPLVALYNYSYKYDEIVFNEGKAASALGGTVEQMKPLLLDLANDGFITYDTETKMVSLNQKTENFVKGKTGKKDYDNIIFRTDFRPKKLKGYTEDQIKESSYLQQVQENYLKQNEERRVLKQFGKLDLKTMDLNLVAVDMVTISSNQNTHIYPEAGEITIKKNRDFNFSGWLNSGKMEINAKSAAFNYEDFKITLNETKASLFRVRPLQREDGNQDIAMQSIISGLKGTIQIDDPQNRSGAREDKYPGFPKMDVTVPTKLFYNSKDIYRGAYDSTRFYYTISPFAMDSLDNFSEKSLRLKGELTSAGIFPTIKEDLKIMPDYSFGFSIKAPAGGYDFYGTGAKYENKIILSYNGLQGAGTINFVNSTSISKALSFLPDSTVGLAEFVNKPIETGIEFPDAKSDEAYITYIPKQNMLRASSTPRHDINMFNDEAKFRGTAIIRPKGMTGDGVMLMATATVISDQFRFKRWIADADTSNFNLKNKYREEGEDALSFTTTGISAHISFKDRKGDFKSNDGESTVNFPLNQYICKMDMFTWFMDNETMELATDEKKEISIDTGVDLKGPNFYSVHPKQDSLQFRAPKANFSLKEKTIYCDKVEYIDVADARIYPDSMKVRIRKKAKMDELLNAEIVANYITKYHKFTKAKVQISARRAYEGEGLYPYYDADSTLTLLTMNKISLDTSFQTVAYGKVGDNENFKLSKEFDYYGNVAIKAANPLINFSGATRINHGCDKFERNWLAFNSEIDPKNIQIPVSSKMVDLEGDPIAAGIVWRDSKMLDSIRLYPTFLSALEDKEDPIVFTASGYLSFDPSAKEFQISSREKLLNRGEKGNFLALHTESCSMNGDGVVNLGLDLADVTVDAVGVVNYNQKSGLTEMNLTAKFNMPVDNSAFKGIADKLNEIEGLQPVDFTSTTLEQAALEWSGRKAADKLKEDFTVKGEVKKLPSEMESAITVTGLRLSSYAKSSDQDKGLITNVESAALVCLGEKPVMKYVPFKAFFQQINSLAGKDKFGLLMDIPGGRDYLFSYDIQKKDGTLKIVTGDGEFADAVNSIKEDKRKVKNFSYEISTQTSLRAIFLRHFE